ncbi:MAG: transglutaminase family protein [bacterium]
MEDYLRSTEFLDADSPAIIEFARSRAAGASGAAEKAVRIFYAVRDEIRYDPYSLDLSRSHFKASATLARGRGFCIPKAVLLAAACRAEGVPSRLRFADVRNHLTTERLKSLMGGDVFYFHGYTELFLRNRWIRVTPTFNLSLCERFNVKPLDFDGEHDAVFHQFDRLGNRHMEYLKDHGAYADLPYEKVVEVFEIHYLPRVGSATPLAAGDFEAEAAADCAGWSKPV